MNPEELNKILQKEATELLESTQLLNKLEKFGRLVLGGCFVYGTMVDEDIDISLIVDENNIFYEFRKHIMDLLLEIEGLDGIAMTDRYHNPKDKAPKGIWFGPIVNYKKRKWNIDIWLVTQNETSSHHNSPLHQKMLNITEEQRKTILKIKHEALMSSNKEKGTTSAKIYKAVFENGISSYAEYEKLAMN